MKLSLAAGAACLACQLLVAAPVLAQQNNSSTNNNASQRWQHNENSNSGAVQPNSTDKKLNQDAVQMFKDIANAQAAIKHNSKSQAQSNVQQALQQWQQMSSVEKANGAVIVPLYSELDETQTLAPMAMQHKSNNEDAAQNRYAPVTVEQASGQFTFVGLDLDKAKKKLDAAEAALNNGNMEAANDALRAVGDELVTGSVQANYPLLAARENLGIAEGAIQNGHERQAKAALNEASKDLDSFSTGSQHHGSDAKNLASQIQSFSQNLNQNQNHQNAENKIDGWWKQINSWFGSQNGNSSRSNS